MPGYKTLRLQTAESVAWLTLSRPEARNAMSPGMGDEFQDAVQAVQRDEAVRVLVVTGEGKSFSSGGDLKGTAGDFALPVAQRRDALLGFYPKFLCLTQLEIPTVAMVNGHAVGAGMMLALACDLRVMSRAATLSTGFTRIGLSPGMGATFLVPRLVGASKALELLWSSERLEADEALRLGLVTRVAAPEELRSATDELTRRLAAGPIIPIKLIKRAVYRQFGSDLQAALEYEALCQVLVTQTEDLMEGVGAFLEKREPKFKGR